MAMETENSPPQQLKGATLRTTMDAPWWSGVVVDSVSGFSTLLVFILGGVLLLRKWQRKRRTASD
jgi:hypothetical protein